MEIASIIGLACFIAACFLAALTGALFRPGEWYERLKKPTWRPPNRLFAPVWTALYLMIAVAGWLIWRKASFAGTSLPLAMYALQLILNAAWSPLFFGLHRPDLGFVDIVLVWMSIIATNRALLPDPRCRRAAARALPCVGYVRYRAEFRRMAFEFGGVTSSIMGDDIAPPPARRPPARHQNLVPGGPLKGPAISEEIHPP
jgi:benzodiazapine receptor